MYTDIATEKLLVTMNFTHIMLKAELLLYIAMQQHLVEQPAPVVQQDTLVYADIGPSSLKNRGKQVVTLKPDDMDDRVEYALLNHSLQKPDITTNQNSMTGRINNY
jgi:hypothetical protein